jgi:hypothetical protein
VELDKETGNTLEKGMMNVENVGKVNAFDNKNISENEDDDGESIEEKDAEGVSDDEIKNSSEEEAGFKDTSDNAFDDKDTDEKPEKPENTDEKPEKPEKGDVTVDINTEGEYDSTTYFIRQSSTKTEAVARYVEFPVLNHVVHLVTSLSNQGTYSEDALMMKSEEDVYEKPEKRDVVDEINPEGKHYNEKNEEKQVYKKPEKKDVVADINFKGKYDDNNPVEDDRKHLIKGDGFEDTEGMNDEDEKRKAMLTNPASKHREVDVVEQFLKGMEHKSTAAG